METNSHLLPGEPEVLDRAIRRACESLPVVFRTGLRVSAVTDREVQVSSGETIRADLTVWTGGAAPPNLLAEAGLAERPGVWAAVKPTLQSVFFDNIFVAGDAVALPRPVAKQAYHAMDMGSCAARNVCALLSGRELIAFKPSSEVTLIAFGDLDTYVSIGGHVVSGAALAAAKEAVYQVSMARMDPQADTTAFFLLQDRAWTGAFNLLPLVVSPASLLRLSEIRMLD